MSLQEELERMKKELEEAEAAEAKAEQEPEPTPAPEPAPEATPEPTPTPTPAPPPEPDLDNSGYAKLRREAAAERKRAEQAEAKRLELEAKLKEFENPAPVDDTPAPAQLPVEVSEIIEQRRFEKAAQEFMTIEEKFRAKTPEYDAVSTEYAQALSQAIRIQNPRLSPIEVIERTKKEILTKAADYYSKGFDPVEELFHEAKELGFTGATQKERIEKLKEDITQEEANLLAEKAETRAYANIKPDMNKVAENRKQSSGMAAATGKSEGVMTQRHAAESLSAQEWIKLPVAERQRLMYG